MVNILYAVFPPDYKRYIEPFGGSGAVLLGKPVPDHFEIYNDRNKNLVNLFRCARDRPLALILELGFFPLNSRDDFKVIKKCVFTVSLIKSIQPTLSEGFSRGRIDSIAFNQRAVREEFTSEFLSEELELTKILLPEPQASELRKLYSTVASDCDVR